MNEGGYVILFDGFDEVNKEKIAKISTEIKNISGKYNDNHYIVSSRPSDEFIGWNDFVEMSSMKLTKDQALSLIKKIEFDESAKEKFYNELNEYLFDKYESFASNPLLLNIMLLTYNDHATFPDKLNDFYEQAFITLFNMHDATKESYVRDIRTKLGCEDFKAVFSYICFKSYFAGQYEFSDALIRNHIQMAKDKFNKLSFTIDDFLEDLTSSVCMLIKDGLNYRFTHRSFQEYFAACYTCKLTDSTQKVFLSNWIKESDAALNDSYFSMLFNMQGDKVNKIVFAPILKQIKKLYVKHSFSVTYLKQFFAGLSVAKSNFDDKLGWYFSCYVKNKQYLSTIMLTSRLNGYFPDKSDIYSKGIEQCTKLVEIESKKAIISIDDAVEIMGEENFLKSMTIVKKYTEKSMSVLQECERNVITNKKSVAAILDEL